MSMFHRILALSFLFSLAVVANAQSDRDYEQTCRTEVARRFNLSRDRVNADKSGSANGQARVQWRVNDRNGYCLIDRRMNVVDFQDFAQGGNNNGNGRRDDWDDNNRWRPISQYPRVKVDTDGHGSFSGENNSLRIRRGYVNTRDTTSVTLSCEKNYRVTFNGDVVQANGDREFVIRITNSDRGDARGMVTVRLNSNRDEVEFISVRGRLNGRNIEGTFDRN